MRSLFSSTFVLVVDLTLVGTVWILLAVVPMLILALVDSLLLPIPVAAVTAVIGATFAGASFIASILCVRFLMRLFPYVLAENGGLRIAHPGGILLLVALFLGICAAFVLYDTAASTPSRAMIAGASGVAYCSGLWFGLRNRLHSRLEIEGVHNAVFLRRFHSLADRAIIEPVRSALPLNCRLVILRSPQDLLRLWDPVQILFHGLDLRHPWQGIPVYIHSDSNNWVGHVREVLRSAQLVVVDVSTLSEALSLELSVVRELDKSKDVIFICERSRVEAVSEEIGVPEAAIIPYQRSASRSFFRFVLGFVAVANGCFLLNLVLLLLLLQLFEADSVPIAWVRGLWEALGRDILNTISVLGLPLYLWASWRLVWTARLDGASSARIKHAIRAKLAAS